MGGFLLYYVSRWMRLLLANSFPQLTHELSVAMLAVSLTCFIGWSLMLTREGEKETSPFGKPFWALAAADTTRKRLELRQWHYSQALGRFHVPRAQQVENTPTNDNRKDQSPSDERKNNHAD